MFFRLLRLGMWFIGLVMMVMISREAQFEGLRRMSVLIDGLDDLP